MKRTVGRPAVFVPRNCFTKATLRRRSKRSVTKFKRVTREKHNPRMTDGREVIKVGEAIEYVSIPKLKILARWEEN